MNKLLFILLFGSLFADNEIAINSEWTGLFPSLNLEYKFQKQHLNHNIVRFGVGKIKNGCSDCDDRLFHYDGYLIIPSLSIYREKNIENHKEESGYTFVMGSDSITIARVKTDEFSTKNKKFVFRMGYGYGVFVNFSSLAHSIPIILPTFGFGINF